MAAVLRSPLAGLDEEDTDRFGGNLSVRLRKPQMHAMQDATRVQFINFTGVS